MSDVPAIVHPVHPTTPCESLSPSIHVIGNCVGDKHHWVLVLLQCRCCGRVHCHTCSAKLFDLSTLGEAVVSTTAVGVRSGEAPRGGVRVCDTCFSILRCLPVATEEGRAGSVVGSKSGARKPPVPASPRRNHAGGNRKHDSRAVARSGSGK